ncbi:IS200/IS605 family element transposase accessory protein TnpB [Lactobacillus salivarius]|uniref:RNA-guided endonuclease InsQ/TnpB family protein n=1 Tax=Ligilactobacillus salivarius TaxID=1624 RepID=UPI001368AAB9|nr:RNA-guided endonuclease TnpB family protein [Ligilactobacillus salivarius]MYY59084.1 IS200/IS605 family element transposase accessory protein TnpB [Ligilactobacillus salivarius]
MVKKQKSKKKVIKTFKEVRAEKTEVQYKYLVEKHIIKSNDARYAILDKYAHLSNNVYNQALYRFRQAFFKGKWLSYEKLDKSFKQSFNQKDCMLYRSMKSVHLAQQILKLVNQNMTSWNKARKAYLKAPQKFTGKPKIPKYKTKGGKNIVIVDNQTAKLRANGIVEIPVMDSLKIKLQHKETNKIQQVRVIPKNNTFVIEIVYKTNKVIDYKEDNGRYLTIDPGLDNAFTLASNVKGFKPVIINGRPLKSVNQYYNKQKARLTRIYDLSKQNRNTKRLNKLDFYRNQKMLKFAHEASKRIVEIALSHELNTIVIGKNKGQKRSSNMGKRINQNFIGIPHQKMIEMIEYKANLAGIVVIQANEDYTSQTSFLDNEVPINQNGDKARKRKGLSPVKRRIKRGLFKSNKGILINADVNGALQILRKVVPNAFADGIDGIGLVPVKLNLNF